MHVDKPRHDRAIATVNHVIIGSCLLKTIDNCFDATLGDDDSLILDRRCTRTVNQLPCVDQGIGMGKCTRSEQARRY